MHDGQSLRGLSLQFQGRGQKWKHVVVFLCCCSQPNRIGIELYPVLTRREAISPAGLPELCPIFLHVFFKVWILHLLEFEHFATLHSCIACPKLSKGAFCRTFRSSSRQHGQDLRKRLGQGSGGCASLVGPPQSQQPRKSTQLPVNFLGLDLGTWAPAAVLFEKFSRAYWLPGISRQTSNDKAGCMARALVEAIQPGSLDPPEGFSQDSPSM